MSHKENGVNMQKSVYISGNCLTCTNGKCKAIILYCREICEMAGGRGRPVGTRVEATGTKPSTSLTCCHPATSIWLAESFCRQGKPYAAPWCTWKTFWGYWHNLEGLFMIAPEPQKAFQAYQSIAQISKCFGKFPLMVTWWKLCLRVVCYRSVTGRRLQKI